MAIYHLSMKPIARGSGRSAVAAAAYRSGSRLTNERDGLVHDFRRKGGIDHSEIVLPEGAEQDCAWALERERLWNAAEFAERRKDARVAREFEIALPHELTAQQRLELTRDFARHLADRYKVALDFAIHAPDQDTDIRNSHAHVLVTTREVTETGLGDKTALEKENRELIAKGLPTSHEQLRDIRLKWEDMANQHLARAGHDIRIDHRSHRERGLELEPTQHMGVQATQMEQRGADVERKRLEAETARRNAERIRANPDAVLSIITDEKSVFDKRDIARTLHRYINDDATEYQALLTKVMASSELVKLQDGEGEQPARYSTREMVDLEGGMMDDALAMDGDRRHGVSSGHVTRAITRQDDAIGKSANAELIQQMERGEISKSEMQKRWQVRGLGVEQIEAIEHITDARRIGVVVGYAGAGKSTLLTAAREAWEAQGYAVHGAALAGKAAEGLEESSGIASRTLASWQYGWKKDMGRLTPNDVLVIDEAGMVGSRQLSAFVKAARQSGAKLVLVGDHEQLQAIGAGAAFRAIAEEVGFTQLSEVRRQKEEWQKEASVKFASHRTTEALEAYDAHGAIRFSKDSDQARTALVRDYLEDMKQNPALTRAVLAHRRVDVQQLNIDIREGLKEKGLLPGCGRPMVAGSGERIASGADALEVVYATDKGVRAFVPGDRIVFLKNDGQMDVKNGSLGTVRSVHEGNINVLMDGAGQRTVSINTDDYKAFDHGYATTIHKSQGATVDRAFVLASDTMDRHLTYVAMTRHREAVTMYAGQDQFDDKHALTKRLSRSGVKETTLDYPKANTVERFAERRGIDSDIVMLLGWGKEDGKGGISRSESPALSRDDHGGQAHRGSDTVPREHAGGNDQAPSSRNPDQAAGIDLRQRYETALETFAEVFARMALPMSKGASVSEADREKVQRSSRTLEEIKPGTLALLREVLADDLASGGKLMAMKGQTRVRKLVEALALKSYSVDPNMRADVLEGRWNELTRKNAEEGGALHWSARHKLEAQMRDIIKAVQADHQVGQILTRRWRDRGVDVSDRQTLSSLMERQIPKDRDRGPSR